jgi:hypothetical protein
MSPRLPTALELGLAVGLALLCAVAVAAGLGRLAQPSRFDARMAIVERDSEHAATLLRAPSSIGGANLTCSSASSAEGERLRGQLAAMASTLPLQHASVEVSPEPAPPASTLATLAVRLSGAGPYDAALAALGRLAAIRPLVFVDTVDLTSKTSFVTFSISGRVFCAAPR